MANKKIGVLLVNLGSPASPTVPAVRKFLKDFLGDKRVVNIPRFVWLPILHGFILPFRPKKSLKAYVKIWNTEKGSPLTYLTRQLTENVAARFNSENVLVEYAMSYGEPSIPTQLRKFKEQSVTDVIVLPLYPQYSSTTSASVYDSLIEEFNSLWHFPSFRFVSDYHQNERYIAELAKSVESAWREKPKNELLVMSFHGLPEMLTKKGDPYFYQCQKTAALLAAKLDLKENEWRLVFQSRFGKAEWLKPYCVDMLEALPKEGVKTVDLICPGFAVDCLETLEEIAMENKHIFLEAGGEDYSYIPALNDSAANVEVMLDVLGELK
ncbi:MAG: ferrochelatase [Methylococcaceae bacterium]|nr:ferrochelatase [Methylococcaceae bacterium]